MNPTGILLVDDHALVRAGIRALIGMIEGTEVVGEAGDGSVALRLVEARPTCRVRHHKTSSTRSTKLLSKKNCLTG